LFTGWRFFGDGLPIATFQNLVGLQGDLQQGYQGFYPAGRFQKDRPYRKGRFHLMMQQFDLSKNAIIGEAIPIAEKIYSESGAGVASFNISQNGILTYAGAYAVGSSPSASPWVPPSPSP
jgi:hypothetical protein